MFGIHNKSFIMEEKSEENKLDEEIKQVEIDNGPVRWTPSDAFQNCERCDNPFGWFTWKHHCRKCGKLS